MTYICQWHLKFWPFISGLKVSLMEVMVKDEFFYVSKYMTNLFIHPYFMQALKKGLVSVSFFQSWMEDHQF